ncbi:hydroxymethylglutaryl-CoA synthase 1 [Diabrotica virgifera virgifera]|uniref:Hydroxymethylglutaryl-CoA synthase n=1 Tax=Diabrotica virgifera virgifera TaxID=50390 RepID=A0A6P7F2U2_DIAVI|nr:hydroxymethylglutaryl-CoA synthase 1 [Diabrotica virgifera virgifera]
MDHWPKDVGILALELYIPSLYVDQTELEVYDGVSTGKYTIGLGQQKMGFCTDREDINSLCLTAVQKLMENYNVSPQEVGRLEVGTETIIDKSKSVKTVLMQLFEPHGITDIEGIDTTNACYGGTAALINAVNWIESSSWNGRYAIVVAADIAVYAKGSARPTGGAGAVAMLLGPNAPLVIDRGVRATYLKHAYDFYKPDLTSEYPVVDGKLSIQCYLSALDNCYSLYKKKVAEKHKKDVTLKDFDAVLFHTPFCKLVQKSVGRMALNDFLQKPDLYPSLEKFQKVKLEDSYFDRDLEKAFVDVSKQQFVEKTQPSLLVATQVGNMYTSSLYGGLVSLLVNKKPEVLAGNKIVLFSYGSGLAASMFSLTVSNNTEALKRIISNSSLVKSRLEQRVKFEPKKFEASLELRQETCHKAPYEPISSIEGYFPGTYYLIKIDDMHRRFYNRIPSLTNGYS